MHRDSVRRPLAKRLHEQRHDARTLTGRPNGAHREAKGMVLGTVLARWFP